MRRACSRRTVSATAELGLFEGARVYDTEVQVRAQIIGTTAPDRVTFLLDDGEEVDRDPSDGQPGEGTVATLDYALGGFDATGSEQSYSLAGGFKERASKEKIYIIREGDPKQKREQVGLNIPVEPGDILTIEESFF